MALFKLTSSDFTEIECEGERRIVLSKKKYDAFNASLLGLGDLTQDATATDAIAVNFDLQGFTVFCKQIEPHLAVPLFLSQFLCWLMERIKVEMTVKDIGSGVRLYNPLPFFIKFMGDGLLVLLDSSLMNNIERRNVILVCFNICQLYRTKFLKAISSKVVDAPPVLRCAVARGTVYSVGNGNDFVGSCINMSARLQRIPGITFAFNRRGFDLECAAGTSFFKDDSIMTRVSIRGINENELIGVLKAGLASMKPEDKKAFRPV
jgi:hypothetical protein